MLTNACKYAIRAILFLGMHTDETKKIGVKKIAEDVDIPQPFLSKLLQKLTRNNLVSSTKGPNGGFFLNKRNKQNSVWDIIVCIDRKNKFDHCFLGLPKCSDENPCPVHFIVSPFKQNILESFKDKTIAEFVNEIEKTGKVIALKDLDIFKK